jgi:starvation-inducible DNA-binding protein
MAKTATQNGRVFTTHNPLPEDPRARSIELLNQSLAAMFDLQSQTKQAHWNVKGDNFYSLHLLFDEIAGELSGFVDDIAERAIALGGYAFGTARMASEHSLLPEYPVGAIQGRDHVVALVERFGKLSAHLLESIEASTEAGDPDTADLYTTISRTFEKRLWFLEAHIQKAS